MIRSELVARIAAQNPHLFARDVEAVVNTILDRMTDALADGDRVELRGFGAFSTRAVEAHTGRNPRSGAIVQVAAKTSIHFSPSKVMQARLNREKIEPEDEAERLLRAS
ncbi:integration host factor subunit beta [Methylobacterium sp. E-065]|uniref:HU family DNA-binding protein n=1 Tax=Methylobacterium sp. E-065 TaxID=2836583 RepID=UPI001FB8E2F1|nr:HU family DNA-binding protein [Methylobacterium sp. E-065]MCJ2016872.1 integration host factor subunit beta [Methylobacterium sp. E-065]